jgi:hypothetical protein
MKEHSGECDGHDHQDPAVAMPESEAEAKESDDSAEPRSTPMITAGDDPGMLCPYAHTMGRQSWSVLTERPDVSYQPPRGMSRGPKRRLGTAWRR